MPPQHLSARSPSPSTILYTVSTRPQNASKWLVFLQHALRLIVAWHVALCSIAKAASAGLLDQGAVLPCAKLLVRTTLLSNVVATVADSVEWYVIVPVSLAVVYLCLRRDYAEESLLVLQGLGIQTSTSSPYFFLGATTTFIPTSQVQDIVIHEAFRGLEVRFYLAVIVQGATEVVVVFPTLLPRREMLEVVWRGARKCLYTGIR